MGVRSKLVEPWKTPTIGEMIDAGMTIHVICDNCGHTGLVDLDEAAERLGRDHMAMHDDLREHYWCTDCGLKRASFRFDLV